MKIIFWLGLSQYEKHIVAIIRKVENWYKGSCISCLSCPLVIMLYEPVLVVQYCIGCDLEHSDSNCVKWIS